MQRRRRGFTLLEISIAIFVLAIGLVGILAVFPVGVRSGKEANARAVSASLAWEALQQTIHRVRAGGGLCMILDRNGQAVVNLPHDGNPASVGDEVATGTGLTFGYNTAYSSAVIGNVRDGVYRGRMGGDDRNRSYVWEASVGRLTADNATGPSPIQHPSFQKRIREYLSQTHDGRVWEPYLHYVYIRIGIDTHGVKLGDGSYAAGPNGRIDGEYADGELVDEYVTYLSDYIGNLACLSDVGDLYTRSDKEQAEDGTADIGGIQIETFHYGSCPSCANPILAAEWAAGLCADCGQAIQ